MMELGKINISIDAEAPGQEASSWRAILRLATRECHERFHLHSGFSRVKDGTIDVQSYQALLIRLYGFQVPFERSVGEDRVRTRWLENDLVWLGVNAETFRHIPICENLPRYDLWEKRLGGLYVVEGSALGGRQLCRGLDSLLGEEAVEGRRFFAGRGEDTRDAWSRLLRQIDAVGLWSTGGMTLVDAAVRTFEVFETWIDDWSGRK